MKRIILVLFVNLCIFAASEAQDDVREQVYVHLNNHTFISGETIYFAAYCNSQLTGEPSGMSKILYVEIIGKNGPVHQQKVYLNEGKGNSQFFISSLVPTGQYYLIAFTKWMKNFDDYFQSPVLIINPFESYPNEVEDSKSEIEFFSPQDDLVPGVENVIAYHFKASNTSNIKGKVVSTDGEVIQNFRVETQGLGKLKMTPRKGQSYQAILEDELGSIKFYDLPRVGEEGAFITYEEDETQITLKCNMGNRRPDSLKLTLTDGSFLQEILVLPNLNHSVPKEILSRGIIDVQYSDANGTVAKRSILVSQAPLELKRPKRGTYGKREKVTIDTGLDSGAYSISVRRKTSHKLGGHHHAIWTHALHRILSASLNPSNYLASDKRDAEALLLTSKTRSATATPKQVNFLPEVREEIVTGTILDSLGNPAIGQKVSLTFPGSAFQLRIGESDKNGNFFIPFQNPGSDQEAVLTALDFHREFEIRPDSSFLDKHPALSYALPKLDSSLVEEIVAKSIRVQIENAYFDYSQVNSTATASLDEIPIHELYLLDDYKRFPTLKETFTEFIITANLREKRDYPIKTTYFPGLSQAEYPPVVLLDGVPVSGSSVIGLNPYKVESIGVLPNRYFLGPMVMDGIVSIKTFEGDLGGFEIDENYNHKKISVIGATTGAVARFPEYAGVLENPEADQRDQLFWEPAFSPENGDTEFSFYTSDVPGDYEAVIEGFTQDGKPVTEKYEFQIK